MESYFAALAGKPSEESESDEEESKSVKDLAGDLSEEEMLNMCIDQALSGCCDPEMRREHFIRAVALIVKQL